MKSFPFHFVHGIELEHGSLYPCFVNAIPGSNIDSSSFDFSQHSFCDVDINKGLVRFRFNSPACIKLNGDVRLFVPGDVITFYLK